MAEQLQCLGFEFDSQQQLDRFFADHWEKKTLVDLTDGIYLRLDVTPAISCWLSVDPEDQSLLDWDIHCDSGSRLPCAFNARLSCDDKEQSGLISLLLDPGNRDIPVTASCPALALWPQREEGSPGLVSLAFYAAQLRYDSAGEDCLTASPEDNTARLSGSVQAAETCRNPWSGLYYRHITLSCMHLHLDLYCPESLMPTLPGAGARVSADCYITCLAEAGVIS